MVFISYVGAKYGIFYKMVLMLVILQPRVLLTHSQMDPAYSGIFQVTHYRPF